MIVLFILIILNIADYFTTFRILSRGGVEKNPFVSWTICKLGLIVGLLCVKLPPLIILSYISYIYNIEQFLVYLVVLYIIVVLHNLNQLRKY